MKNIITTMLSLIVGVVFAQQRPPTFEEVISLRSVNSVIMSPDGKNVAFTITTADWNDNRFDTEIWLSKDGKKPFQLTNTTKNNSTNAAFSPDGQWIAFLSDRDDKSQLYVMRVDGGEAHVITKEDEGISGFEWHPSGAKFVILKQEKDDKSKKDREKKYGGYEIDDKEFALSHLWTLEFKADMPDPSEMPCHETTDSLKIKAGCIELPKLVRLTEASLQLQPSPLHPMVSRSSSITNPIR